MHVNMYIIMNNIYAYIINIQVPHEVKNQRAAAKGTSKFMKWTDVKYPNG